MALKVLVSPAPRDETQRRRFLVEAQALARLAHPNIVVVHDAGEESGHPYLVVEWLPGGSLDERISRGPVPAREAVSIAVKLARAVEHAHASAIIHRDLKPANVLFDARGEPRLTDFGLAKELALPQGTSRAGTLTGTPGYWSPEQASGMGAIGPATDVYGLGAILYAALAGHPPIALGESVLACAVATLEQVPAPPSGDPALDAIVLRCLEKEPSRRFASAGEVARALEQWLARPPTRRAPIALAAAGLALAATGGLAIVAIRGRDVRPQPPPPAPRSDATERLVDGRAYRTRAEAALRAGDARAAVRDLSQAIALDARDAEARIDRGLARERLGDALGALEDYDAAIRLRPSDASFLNRRAVLLMAQRRFDEAEADVRRALDLAPRRSDIWSNLGLVQYQRRDFAGAEASFTRALEIEPEMGGAFYNRGLTREALQDREGARRDLDRAVEFAPTLASAWSARARLRGATNDHDGALADFERALALDPSDARTWFNSGVARARKGDLAGAIRDQTRAIEADPGYRDAWFNRAVARRDLGRRIEAAEDFERFLALAPEHPQAPAVRKLVVELRARR